MLPVDLVISGARQMLKLKGLQALLIYLQMSSDFCRLGIPFVPWTESHAKSRMVLCVVQIHDFAQNCHQGEKISKDTMTSTLILGPAYLRRIRDVSFGPSVE